MDGWDVDLPTYLEANYVCTTVTKTLWVLVYIAVYGLRPIIIRPKKAGDCLVADLSCAYLLRPRQAYPRAILHSC